MKNFQDLIKTKPLKLIDLTETTLKKNKLELKKFIGKDATQRTDCGCIDSVDIGEYDKCKVFALNVTRIFVRKSP